MITPQMFSLVCHDIIKSTFCFFSVNYFLNLILELAEGVESNDIGRVGRILQYDPVAAKTLMWTAPCKIHCCIRQYETGITKYAKC